MSVARSHHTKDYTCMSNYVFKDKSLSLKAKGLLCLMLSLPDEWDYSIKGLASLSSDGETSVRTAIIELQKAGYVKREQVRENGKIIDWNYDIYEKPQTGSETEQDFLDVGNPLLGNPLLDSTDNKVNNNKINNNKIKKDNKCISKDIHSCNFQFGKQSKEISKQTAKEVLAERFLDLYRKHCPSLGDIRKLTPTRIKLINKLYNDYTEEEIINVLDKAQASDFLKGSTGWKATFGWLINENNFLKIYEDNYKNNNSQSNSDVLLNDVEDSDDYFNHMEEKRARREAREQALYED